MSRSSIAAVVILAVMVLAWSAGGAAAVGIDFVDTPPSLMLVGTNAEVLNPDHPQYAGGVPTSPPMTILTQTDPPEVLDEHIAIEKTFLDLEPIWMTWVRGPNAPNIITLEELIHNLTGTAWTDFHVGLLGGAFFAEDQDPTVDPEPVNVTLNPAGTEAMLWFDPPLPSGVGPYTLRFGTVDGVPSLDDVRIDISQVPIGETFTIVQYPTVIPEPATLLLLGAPIGLLIWRRRR